MSEHPGDLLSRWRASIDLRLSSVAAPAQQLPARLRDAVHYSLTGGGKRLRGLLLMASYHSLAGKGDASGLGAAVEVVHAYSLIHDDLPCMDNDTIRRGRPTTHLAFDVETATIAGVAMVPIAVSQTIAAGAELGLEAAVIQQLVRTLMAASGAAGMVGGQLLDLQGEGKSLSVADLERIHHAKTGALIAATFTMGGLAAGGTPRAVAALTAAGTALGLAFQIADDVLDATESSEALGKTAGADAALAKSTYASILGIPAARDRSQALVTEAMTVLGEANLRTGPLEHLAHFVSARRS